MEDVRNRFNYEITSNSNRVNRLLNDPALKRRRIIVPSTTEDSDDGLVGFERFKEEVLLNKPIYCGFSILEFSKLHMQNLYYNTLKPIYN